jgi:type IX secretion system PorP/SprF family membrane protein
MKKIFLITLTALAFASNAQQVPLFSQYLNNDFLLNPAIAGTKSYMPVSVTARLQWVNLAGAPVSQIGSIHGAINKSVGMGLSLTNFTAGPTRMTSAQLAYSYRVKLNDKMKISFGLAPMIIQHSIAKDKVILDDVNDNTFNKLNGKTTIADLDAGVYVYGQKWAASLSAPQVLGSRYRLGDDLFKERLKRHYMLFGSYDFACKDKYILTPSVLVKMMETGGPIQVDVNLKANYDNQFWAGVAYRAASSMSFNEAAVVFVGIQKNNFVFGYSFDYGFSSIRSYSMGSHEVFLTYRLRCKDCDQAAERVETSAKEAQ